MGFDLSEWGLTVYLRWKTWRRQPWSQAYATPLVVRVGAADLLVSPAAHHAAAYDPATGREIWRVHYGDGFSNVPRPVFARGLVFIATGFQQPSMLAVRPDGRGDVTRTHVAWRLARGSFLQFRGFTLKSQGQIRRPGIVFAVLATCWLLFVGHSAGCNVAAALRVARQAKAGDVITTVLADRGDRYFAPMKWEKQYVW